MISSATSSESDWIGLAVRPFQQHRAGLAVPREINHVPALAIQQGVAQAVARHSVLQNPQLDRAACQAGDQSIQRLPLAPQVQRVAGRRQAEQREDAQPIADRNRSRRGLGNRLGHEADTLRAERLAAGMCDLERDDEKPLSFFRHADPDDDRRETVCEDFLADGAAEHGVANPRADLGEQSPLVLVALVGRRDCQR